MRRSAFKGLGCGLGFVCILVAAFLLSQAHTTQSLIAHYTSEGVHGLAAVTGKDRDKKRLERGRTASRYSLDVRLISRNDGTAPSFVFANIHELVTGTIYNSVAIGQEVEVLILPDKPQPRVLLKASTEPGALPWSSRYPFGILVAFLGCLGIGLEGLGWAWRARRIPERDSTQEGVPS